MKHRQAEANEDARSDVTVGARWRMARTAIWCAGGVFAMLSIACYVSHSDDRTVVRNHAQKLVQGIEDPVERVLRLNTWVHRFLPTARNDSYFVVPKLRATPRQVLTGGGDCADKSRLLVALLREIDIPASMALCFHPVTGKPSHTVVDAQPTRHSSMLVDPAYELAYPKPGGSGYYGLLELRQHPELLQERLTYVWDTIPRFRPLHWYNPNVASFSGLSTINWRRNQITEVLHDLIYLGVGPDIYSLPRPRLLESPKLAICVLAALLAMVPVVGWHLLGCILRHRSQASPVPAPRKPQKATPTTVPAAPSLIGQT